MSKFSREDYLQFIARRMKQRLKEGVKRPEKLIYERVVSAANDFDKVHSVIVPGPWGKEKKS